MEKVKQLVMEKETLSHVMLKEILGDRPFESDNENYKKYLKEEEKERLAKEEK